MTKTQGLIKISLNEDGFLLTSLYHSPLIRQKNGALKRQPYQKWTVAVDLQSALPKSDRLLGTCKGEEIA